MRRRQHRGSATVELSICLPLFVVVMTGTIQVCSLIHLRESLCVASYEAARVIAKRPMGQDEARQRAKMILASRGLSGGQVSFQPRNLSTVRLGEPITVTVLLPTKGHSLPARFLGQEWIEGRTVIFKENE